MFEVGFCFEDEPTDEIILLKLWSIRMNGNGGIRIWYSG